MYYIIGLVLVVMAIIIIIADKLRSNDTKKTNETQLDYYLKKQIMSNAEYSFYLVLRNIIKDEYQIYPKIRLIDIVGSKKAYQKLIQKHIDFVIADNNQAKLAIELDDSSHKNRKSADEQKNVILEKAGLKLLRIKCQQAYDTRELLEQIKNKINQ